MREGAVEVVVEEEAAASGVVEAGEVVEEAVVMEEGVMVVAEAQMEFEIVTQQVGLRH